MTCQLSSLHSDRRTHFLPASGAGELGVAPPFLTLGVSKGKEEKPGKPWEGDRKSVEMSR